MGPRGRICVGIPDVVPTARLPSVDLETLLEKAVTERHGVQDGVQVTRRPRPKPSWMRSSTSHSQNSTDEINARVFALGKKSIGEKHEMATQLAGRRLPGSTSLVPGLNVRNALKRGKGGREGGREGEEGGGRGGGRGVRRSWS